MNELSAVVRFLNLTASVLLAGSFGFALLIARPAYLGAPDDAKTDFLSFVRLQLSIARWCLIAIFVSALLGLWFQSLYVSELEAGASTGLGAVFPLLVETQFGRVWLLRMASLIVLAGLIVWAMRARRDHDVIFFAAGFALSAFLLVAAALSGHASADEGPAFVLQVSADMLHLLTCGLWLGGLWPLAVLLRACRRKGDAAACAVATAATQRFSRLALASFAVLIATGGYNAWNLVGGFAPLFGTAYGKLLLVKIGLLLPLLGLGAMNLLGLKPKIVGVSGVRPEETVVYLRRLARNVTIEMVLGLGILLIVAHMGLMPPARHIQPDWPFAFRWNWSVLDKAPDVRDQVLHGIVWLAVGVAAMLYAAARKRVRILAVAVGLGLWVYAGIAILAPVSTDAYPTTYKRPAVAYQAISVANGRRLYVDSGCPVCHGPSGYGDGPSAEQLRPRPADLTAPHANAHTAGDLFWWISYGVKQSAMPGFNESLSEEGRWDLINFLRALSASERARNLEPVIEGEPWLVAPDFSYGTGRGEMRTLRDHRAYRVVLLVLPGPRNAEERLKQLAAALPRLRAAGIEVIVVANPIDYPASSYSGLIVNEGLREITETYTLFARSSLDENLLAVPLHVEFLIDKQGYIRARWLPSEGNAWESIDDLLSQAQVLRNEESRAPAPDQHVH